MAVDPKKVFPKSSRTDRQRASTDRDFAGNSSDEKSKGFVGLNKNIFAIHKNLGAIADLLQAQAKNEKAEDDEEIKKQQREEDAKKKSGMEKVLEGVLSNTILKPIEKIKKVTMGVFERLLKVMGVLGIGTIAMKGLQGIEAWMDGDKSILKKLARDVGIVLAAAGGIFLAINVGLPLLTSAIGGLIGSLGVGGSFSGILAALGNPYVWLGIIAAVGIAYTGTELYKMLKGEYGPDLEGVGSYAPINQEAIEEISKVGMKQYRINERERIGALLEANPELLNDNGEMKNDAQLAIMSMSNDAAKLLMAYNNRLRMSNTGNWDQWDAANMSDKDTKLFNKIPDLITNFRGEWSKFYSLAKEITALMDGKRTMDELPQSIQEKIAGLMSTQEGHKSKMIQFMDEVKAARKGMSNDGKNYMDMFLRRHNASTLLYNTDWWGKVVKPGPILDAVQVKEGNISGLRQKAISTFSNLGALNEDLKEDIGRMPEGKNFNSTSSNNLSKNLDLSSTAAAFSNEKLTTANTLSNYDNFSDKISVVPFDINSEDESNTSLVNSSYSASTEVPSFAITDTDNFYRDLAGSNYGVFD